MKSRNYCWLLGVCLQCGRPGFDSWVGKIPWRIPTPVFLGFPDGSEGKESTCNVGDLGLISELGSSPGGGHGNPLKYSYLENPMDRGAWQATVHEIAKSWTRLSDLTFTFNFNPTKHWSCWKPWGHPTQVWGSQEVNLP